MNKSKFNLFRSVFILGCAWLLVSIVSCAYADIKKVWLQDPQVILSEFKKEYKIEKDSDGWYWFLGKNYKAIEQISEGEISRIPAMQLLEKDENGAKFRSFAVYASAASVETAGENYTTLSLPSAGVGGEVGKPQLPYYGRFINVPRDAEVELVVDNVNTEAIDGEYKVLPVQPPLPDTGDDAASEFTIDREVYKQDKYLFENEPVRIASDVIVRGKRLIYVVYQPILYNPAKEKLKAAWKVEWNLKYKYPEGPVSADKKWEKEFADSIGNMVIDALPEPVEQVYPGGESTQSGQGHKVDTGSDGADYLIIAHDNFYNQVLPLAEWKEKKGYKVRIVKLTEIKASGNPTADEIMNYITTAYTNWSPKPLYLLLVGDSQFLPAQYKTRNPNGSFTPSSTATDLYYAAVDGIDIFPDLLIGRLPAATADQCRNIIDKILFMEKTPPAAASFYSNALIAGYFQDDNRDGIEDRLFMETCEGIKDFLTSNGWNIATTYVTGSAKTPRRYNATSILHYSTAYYLNSQTYLSREDARKAISDIVNSGVCLVQHRDHGGEVLWGDPPFTTYDVNNLTNNSLPALVNSTNCLTGRFDYYTDCFAEAWIKKQNSGAYAVFASTRVSYSWWNDYLSHGMYESIWPNYMETLYAFPGYKPGTAYLGNAVGNGSHLGQILNFGKVFMFDKYAAGYAQGTNKYQFEIFHLFGCPEQEARLILPQALTADYPVILAAYGQNEFVVTVASGSLPVEGARVSMLLKPADFYVGVTDVQGKVHFAFTPAGPGNMQLTITHKDYLPFEGSILIDGIVPTGSIKINNDAASTNSTSVTLNLSATDAGSGMGSGAQMKFSNDNASWSSPEGYAVTKSWVLSSGAGTKTVYVKFKDAAGNWSGVYSDTIILSSAPRVISLSPSSGVFKTDTVYILTGVYSDVDGYTNIKSANFILNTSPDFGAFFAHYRRDQNRLFLYNGTTQVGSYVPGSNKVIETPSGKLYCAQTTVTGSGNNLTVKWAVSFKSPLAGTKNAYLSAGDKEGNSSGWQQKGSIRVNVPPGAVSISPSAGIFRTNRPYTFRTVFSDTNGYADLNIMYLLISPNSSSTNTMYLCYHRGNNMLWLWDGSRFTGGFAPGSAKVIETRYGKLYCANTSVTGSGNNLTINWSISFKSTVMGLKSSYLWAYDNYSAYTGWQKKGSTFIIIP